MPAHQKTKTRAPETKTCESETKPCASETKNLRFGNENPAAETKTSQGIKSATPTDNNVEWDILLSTCLRDGSNPPPPLTTMLIGILPSTYLHKGANLPPPLTTMCVVLLPSIFIFIRDQIRHPL